MVLPQFSLRMVLGLVAVFAFISLIISRGVQGSAWAMGVSVALAAVLFLFLTHALAFGIIYVLSQPFSRQAMPRAAVSRQTVSPLIVADSRDPSGTTPPFNESP